MVKTYLITILALVLAKKVESQNSITLKWDIQHPITKEWIPLGDRGSVQEALINQAILPEPFYGDNETKFQWIEEHEWTARAEFFINETLYLAESIRLAFPCIDTYASVYVNNQKVLEANNYFLPYTSEIKKWLMLGKNKVEVVFTPPVIYHKSRYEQENFHYPAPNDNAKIKAAPLTRKPQFQFGWDWAPRLNTMGFPYPVSISLSSPQTIVCYVVNTLSIEEEAKMELVVEKSKGHRLRSSTFGWTVDLDSNALQRIPFSVKQPLLWWPKDFGHPYLYFDTLTVEDAEGKVIERKPISFGIRTVELTQQQDEWGTSFAFKINGKFIFMKGGNMIPPSMFGGKSTKEEWESWVQLMAESNFNMVRIWGGGDYATEDFLNECDRLGLMVWHDAMFACAMYPGDSAFLANVKDEFEFQLPRITKHPSVVYINGNNEVDVAWKNWGFQNEYKLTSTNQAIIQKSYDTLFKFLLPKCLATFSNLPYIHTSPLSNWGKSEYFKHGTQHYWGVWHGTDPMADFSTNIGRFNAEFGFQSFPAFSTLSAFCQEKDWDLESPIMKHHQKSYVGNGMILKHAQALYGKPKDFREFVYLSQLTQAYAVSSAIGSHLLDAPRCMGSLYWQINDCWPGPTWSSVDFYGNKKALHSAVSRLYQNNPLVLNELNGKQVLYAVNSNENDYNARLTINVYSLNKSKCIMIDTTSVNLSVAGFGQFPLISYDSNGECNIIQVQRSNGVEEFFILGRLPKDRKVKYSLKLGPMDVGKKSGVLVLENKQFMANVWIFNEMNGVQLRSNFQHFLPGKHLIPFSFDGELGAFNLMYR